MMMAVSSRYQWCCSYETSIWDTYRTTVVLTTKIQHGKTFFAQTKRRPFGFYRAQQLDVSRQFIIGRTVVYWSVFAAQWHSQTDISILDDSRCRSHPDSRGSFDGSRPCTTRSQPRSDSKRFLEGLQKLRWRNIRQQLRSQQYGK